MGTISCDVGDMSPEEGIILPCRLQDWATQDKYVDRHKWKVGDFLPWDNTGTMHRADTDSLDGDRVLHRTMLYGKDPVSGISLQRTGRESWFR